METVKSELTKALSKLPSTTTYLCFRCRTTFRDGADLKKKNIRNMYSIQCPSCTAWNSERLAAIRSAEPARANVTSRLEIESKPKKLSKTRRKRKPKNIGWIIRGYVARNAWAKAQALAESHGLTILAARLAHRMTRRQAARHIAAVTGRGYGSIDASLNRIEMGRRHHAADEKTFITALNQRSADHSADHSAEPRRPKKAITLLNLETRKFLTIDGATWNLLLKIAS